MKIGIIGRVAAALALATATLGAAPAYAQQPVNLEAAFDSALGTQVRAPSAICAICCASGLS